jgi:hypothetical protein
MDVVLQYASTIIGVVALAVWIALWYRRTAPQAEVQASERTSHSRLGLGMLALALSGGLVRAIILTGVPRSIDGGDKFLAMFGVTSLAVGFWELLVYSLVTTARHAQFAAKSNLQT